MRHLRRSEEETGSNKGESGRQWRRHPRRPARLLQRRSSVTLSHNAKKPQPLTWPKGSVFNSEMLQYFLMNIGCLLDDTSTI
jgi:hypothetical protein